MKYAGYLADLQSSRPGTERIEKEKRNKAENVRNSPFSGSGISDHIMGSMSKYFGAVSTIRFKIDF